MQVCLSDISQRYARWCVLKSPASYQYSLCMYISSMLTVLQTQYLLHNYINCRSTIIPILLIYNHEPSLTVYCYELLRTEYSRIEWTLADAPLQSANLTRSCQCAKVKMQSAIQGLLSSCITLRTSLYYSICKHNFQVYVQSLGVFSTLLLYTTLHSTLHTIHNIPYSYNDYLCTADGPLR